ncbi:hypothetical protein J2X05_000580 [Cellvibrio fibrivorans]|uniref:Uncharacterized protein n=1 Tax=Cellvibrio fibrivorans TaxID=126350 RepID=A0ABU1UTR2_9GAMM|nr:hypothetical protein [Cellvibrio fibrivorans]
MGLFVTAVLFILGRHAPAASANDYQFALVKSDDLASKCSCASAAREVITGRVGDVADIDF